MIYNETPLKGMQPFRLEGKHHGTIQGDFATMPVTYFRKSWISEWADTWPWWNTLNSAAGRRITAAAAAAGRAMQEAGGFMTKQKTSRVVETRISISMIFLIPSTFVTKPNSQNQNPIQLSWCKLWSNSFGRVIRACDRLLLPAIMGRLVDKKDVKEWWWWWWWRWWWWWWRRWWWYSSSWK